MKIEFTRQANPRVSTDAYSIATRVRTWGYDPKHGNHGRGADAREEEGDGWCAVYVHTMEGLWSRWRNELCPPRGTVQEQLPLSLGFFAFVHRASTRGQAWLHALLA
jgi:hypothetical protein